MKSRSAAIPSLPVAVPRFLALVAAGLSSLVFFVSQRVVAMVQTGGSCERKRAWSSPHVAEKKKKTRSLLGSLWDGVGLRCCNLKQQEEPNKGGFLVLVPFLKEIPKRKRIVTVSRYSDVTITLGL